jgi:FKBP-type peptidyl-prolyl cis-trans isomerase
MHHIICKFGLIVVAILLCGCTNTNNHYDETNTTKKGNKKESLAKVNRYLVNTETKEIDNYIARHELDITETGSGLKYQIIRHGDGEKAKRGKIVTLEYKLKVITGDVLYSSEKDGPKVFRVGYGGVESGLEEAILNMRVGDEAIIIIPSHLGHGLLGDRKKIPQRSTIIYEIEFTNIN